MPIDHGVGVTNRIPSKSSDPIEFSPKLAAAVLDAARTKWMRQHGTSGEAESPVLALSEPERARLLREDPVRFYEGLPPYMRALIGAVSRLTNQPDTVPSG